MAQPWRLDHALEHFLDLIQKRHYEGWELVQAQPVGRCWTEGLRGH